MRLSDEITSLNDEIDELVTRNEELEARVKELESTNQQAYDWGTEDAATTVCLLKARVGELEEGLRDLTSDKFGHFMEAKEMKERAQRLLDKHTGGSSG